VKSASPRHWGKIEETEWQTQPDRHQRVFEGKGLESGVCCHALKSRGSQVRNEYVHGQSENGIRDLSKGLNDLTNVSDNLNARSGCVRATLRGAPMSADPPWTSSVPDHANEHRVSDCRRVHVHDHGEHAYRVNDADAQVHGHGHESDPT